METKDILLKLRTDNNLTQEQLAEKVFVSRQAVSKWETGEALPGTDTLRLLSRLYSVSINTLLGSPMKLICQCCGMPLDDGTMSREPDGDINEDYCKWCYADGRFAYDSMDQLIDFLAKHMSGAEWTEDQAREYFKAQLPSLKHWKEKKDGD